MSKLEFVDTHIHLWDLSHPHLHYGHLAPDFEHPIIGERYRPIKGSNYLVDDYIAETRSSNVVRPCTCRPPWEARTQWWRPSGSRRPPTGRGSRMPS